MIIAIIMLALFFLLGLLFISQKHFGKLPSGERLKRVRQSSHYKGKRFENLNHTPQFTNGASYFSILKDYFTAKSKQSEPPAPIPTVKTDLHNLDPQENVIVWFGHSSYFIQVDGKTVLVDPVFSASASPIPGTNKCYPGSNVYQVKDLPNIDYLIITHDHWDHLDYDTVIKLKPKVGRVITSLGVGEHLEYWGYEADRITENDWFETVDLGEGFVVHAMPARHFSGRWLTRQPSLWSSFVLQTPTMKLYLGGDSGYDTHFEEIGSKYGPFDLAILECGQYNTSWQNIHMMPEELVQAGKDLNATRLMPVHWAKFTMALHAWDDPIRRVTKVAKETGVPLVTPMIGEKTSLTEHREFKPWWEEVR